MRARLGFAIATSVEPDILLLDEVLATGDAAFREKSKQRVLELVREAKAIVLVTHDMSWVTEYCNRAILIEKGRIVHEGAPDEVVAIHQEHMAQRRPRPRRRASSRRCAAGDRGRGAAGAAASRRARRPGSRRRASRSPRRAPRSASAATRPNAAPGGQRAAPVEQRPDVALRRAGRSAPAPPTAG